MNEGLIGNGEVTEPSKGTCFARLHPKWMGGRSGYVYSVIHEGKLLVDKSRDAACDSARALLARGSTGKLTMLDGKTGRPRYTLDIERAAGLTVEENRRDGPRFRKYRETTVSASYSRETRAA